MNENTYGYTFTMQAKPGHGEELRALLSAANSGAPAVQSWLIGTAGGDVDSLIGLEFYQDEAAAVAHDKDSDVATIQAQVRGLLASPPTRTVIRPTATNLPLIRH